MCTIEKCKVELLSIGVTYLCIAMSACVVVYRIKGVVMYVSYCLGAV